MYLGERLTGNRRLATPNQRCPGTLTIAQTLTSAISEKPAVRLGQ